MSLASLLEWAQAAHDARDWNEAARGYAAFLAEGGPPLPTLLALGDVLKEAGALDQALDAYEHMARLAPADPEPAFRLGRLAATMDRPAVARSALRKGYRLGGVAHPAAPIRDVLAPGVRELLMTLSFIGAGSDLFSAEENTQRDELSTVDLRLLGDAQALPAASAGTVAMTYFELADSVLRRAAVRALATASRAGATTLLMFVRSDAASVVGHAQALGAELRALRPAPLVFATECGSARALMNVGLEVARARGAHALIVRPGSEQALPAAADFGGDPMAGFAVTGADDLSAGPAWRRGPASSGHGVLIRNRVLAEFGGLDALFDGVDAAIVDLMSRANLCGFGCLLQGDEREKEIPVITAEDAAILGALHPQQDRLRARALIAPQPLAARLASSLLSERSSVLLDLTGLREHHDGTAALSTHVACALSAVSAREVHVWCTEASARFHALRDRRDLVVHAFDDATPEPPQGHAVCFKLGQPLTKADLLRTWTAAPVSGFWMLDSIAMDVTALDDADYFSIWGAALRQSDMIGWLGSYAREQFARRLMRHPRPGDFTALCSTDPAEYVAPSAGSVISVGHGALLIGNPFPHKNIIPTVDRLRRAWPDLPLTVLGFEAGPRDGVTWLRSGALVPEAVDALYAGCELLIFPSFYESFGLPVMHALASGRPVLAIDQPSLREVAARCPLGRNLHLFSTTDTLVAGLEQVRMRPLWATDPYVQPLRWSDAAREIDAAVERALRAFTPVALEQRLAMAQLLAGNIDDAKRG